MAGLVAFLSSLINPVTAWIKNKQTENQAKHERNMKVIENQTRLASDVESHNHEWEMEALKNSDTFLRRFSFFFFISPIFLALIAPDYAATVYTRLNSVPEWNIDIAWKMVAAIWGLAELKRATPALIGGIKQALK